MFDREKDLQVRKKAWCALENAQDKITKEEATQYYNQVIRESDLSRSRDLGIDLDLFRMIVNGGNYKELKENLSRFKKHANDPKIWQLVAEQIPLSIVNLLHSEILNRKLFPSFDTNTLRLSQIEYMRRNNMII